MPRHGDRAKFELRRYLDVAILSVSGEFDMAGVEEFKRLRVEAVNSELPVVIDLTECEFIDSLGLGAIIEAFSATTQAGKGFGLAGSGARVQRLLQISGMVDALPYFSSLEDAVNQVHLHQP
jgi:anti-sigma B factor antagonist